MYGGHSPGTSRMTAAGSSLSPQSIRIVQRKRRPTVERGLDDRVAGEARRDRFEICDFPGRAAAGHSGSILTELRAVRLFHMG
jgi:RNA:NAD 2'-phosphotransferase (TPT1/KptA family)